MKVKEFIEDVIPTQLVYAPVVTLPEPDKSIISSVQNDIIVGVLVGKKNNIMGRVIFDDLETEINPKIAEWFSKTTEVISKVLGNNTDNPELDGEKPSVSFAVIITKPLQKFVYDIVYGLVPGANTPPRGRAILEATHLNVIENGKMVTQTNYVVGSLAIMDDRVRNEIKEIVSSLSGSIDADNYRNAIEILNKKIVGWDKTTNNIIGVVPNNLQNTSTDNGMFL